MITKQQKIEAIYEKITRKDLSFGCKIETKYWESIFLNTLPWSLYNIYRGNYHSLDKEEKIAKIIGHPVMIGDIMEYFYGSVRFSEWGKCWRKLTKPIEEQSDGCINFIYDLIS